MRFFITVLFVLITGTMLFGRSSGLSCYVCSTLTDKNCDDGSDFGKTSSVSMKKDCTEVPAVSLPQGGTIIGAGIVARTVPATKCLKTKVKKEGLSLLSRSCASPGEYDQAGMDESFVGCKSAEGATVCMCRGDYCNGTGRSTLTIQVAICSLLAFLLI